MSGHKIASIAVTRHRLPLDPPFHASWDPSPRTAFEATLVRVATDTGLVGFGSGDAMLGFAGHEHLFIGQDPLAIERHWRILANLDFHYGRCWPLDLALWDLAGKILAQPCWRLLGGAASRVRLYASSGALREPEAMADAAEATLAAGFAALKIRFRRCDWRDDLAGLEAVRSRVGDALTLMVDCNQGWRMPWDTDPAWRLKDALGLARELERLGVYWMEEPLDRADYAGMTALRRATGLRIAGGEMTREPSAFRELFARECLDVVQPDVALVGGITGGRRLAHLAEAAGVVFTPHTWTNGLGLVANAHLVAGLGCAPFLEFPFDPKGWTLDRRDFLLAEPVAAAPGGYLELGDTPGLGVSIDEARAAATRIA
jgi:L-alanine-DL-glutamate epimerase-like enolase superfamily enzyme